MRTVSIAEKENVALSIIHETGADVLEAAILIKELVKRIGRGSMKRARKCIMLGEQELKNREKTVDFARAVEAALEDRANRRSRTISDFRYTMRRFMKRCPEMARRRVRDIKTHECISWIQTAFQTDAQRKKARTLLGGVFSSAIRRGWCKKNPVQNVPVPYVAEKRITILTDSEIERLLAATRNYRNGVCMNAVALMLYAGIRPHEVERLSWDAVDIQSRRICIQPKHSKTGGCRYVTMLPPLLSLLKCPADHDSHAKICPKNWRVHWARLHKEAGFLHWQADVLRHTYASHHLARFRSYAELQLEMGHRSAELLRTRYVAMPTKSFF